VLIIYVFIHTLSFTLHRVGNSTSLQTHFASRDCRAWSVYGCSLLGYD
jgi:hypothetical protein